MSKISRPLQKGVCLRHRLFKKLNSLCHLPVIWISAPAGSGKTTLVSSYINHRKKPCLWYQLDSGDEDLATFFYYMGQAIRKAAPDFRNPMPPLTPEYLRGFTTFAVRYFEELNRRMKKPFTLVLDNYQDVAEDANLHEVIVHAIAQIPDGRSVIIISRSEAPGAFIRLKANSQIGMLGWEDLRLSEEETGTIIRARVGRRLEKTSGQQLHKLSDGWAAGLVLMLEMMKQQKVETPYLTSHAAAEIFEYFAHETFSRLEQNAQEFLARMAFLPQMTASMAAELTGDEAAGEKLEAMHRNNYFISQRSHSEPVFEYHPLYRDFLLNQAARMFGEKEIDELKKRAATILEKAGDSNAAVSLLAEIGDWGQITQIVMEHAAEMLQHGRHQPLQEWLAGLPAGVLEANPQLLYLKGLSLLSNDPKRAQIEFEKAYRAFLEAQALLGSALAAAGVVHSIVYSFENFSLFDLWKPIIIDLDGRINKYPDDRIEASVLAAIIEASELGLVSHPHVEVWAKRLMELETSPETLLYKVQAIHFMFWRRLLYAGAHNALPLLHSLQLLVQHRYSQPLNLIALRTAQVQYFLTSGCYEDLLAAAQKGLALSSETGVHVEDNWLYIHTAISYLDRKDISSATQWLDKTLSNYDSLPNWAKTAYCLQSARLSLMINDPNQSLIACHRALDHSIMTGDQLSQATCQLMLAQIFHQISKKREPKEYLRRVYEYSISADCRSLLVLAQLFEARLLLEEGKDDRCCKLLGQALAAAREGGHFFNIFDNPNYTMKMCEKALEEGIESDYVRTIIRRRGFIPEEPPVHIEAWPWEIKVITLGSFSIVRADGPIRFSRKVQQKPLALVKALIALGGKDVNKERLTEILWPDVEGDLAHQSFNTTLHRLRKLLGCPEAIVLKDGRVSLDDRYCWVDVWALERLVEQADASKKQRDLERAACLTEKAVALYRGDFLSGESEEPWILGPSERFRSLFYRNASWLGRHLQESGNCERAAEYYERFLESDPCREDFYRGLMLCYRRLERPSDALSAYRRCQKMLATVLGISPSTETESVRATLLST
jgi:LuxR family transcriptional regulator, maltose regulon positive regulatory protein